MAPLSPEGAVASGWHRQAYRRVLVGYAFILPWAIGFLLFKAYPIGASFYISLHQWDLLKPPIYVEFENYVRLSRDPLFWTSILNTLYYALCVPLRLVLALALAMLLNRSWPGINAARALLYLPSATPVAVIAVVWTLMYHPTFGAVNTIFGYAAIRGPKWIASPEWAMPALIFMSLWYVGPMMVIFLAGLKGIPSVLYEAAAIDGASAWNQFKNITLPVVSPVILLNLVMDIILAFQVFASIYIMTGGGPMNRTLVLALYIYQHAFVWLNMGYASALAWGLFLLTFGLTLAQMRVSKRWVFYQ